MAKGKELKPKSLRWRCPVSKLRFKHTGELPELELPIGQERALAALDFGAGVQTQGYNMFVAGPVGTGRHDMARTQLAERAQALPAPDDWCYVYNFDDPRRPRALRLPAGMGVTLREDVTRALGDVQQVLATVFETDDYNDKRDEIVKEFRDARNRELQAFENEAQERGFALGRSPAGLIVAPAVEGEVMTPQQYGELSDEDRQRLDTTREELQGKLGDIMRRGQRDEKETRDRVRRLDQQVVQEALQPIFEDLRQKYAATADVLGFVERVARDIVENVGGLRRAADEEDGNPIQPTSQMPGASRHPLDRYKINVLVSNDPEAGAPIIFEPNPTIDKLTGEVEHQAQMGALVTDFTLINAGALHRANGGFLIIEALQLLQRPYAWEALKRALTNREVRVESLSDQMRFISTTTLEPEPIPLDVKVAMIGSPFVYYALCAYDEEFLKLFKVQADLGSEIELTDEALGEYAQFVGHVCRREGLRHFSRAAVARVIEHGVELAADQEKLSTRLMDVADLTHEAVYWAEKANHKLVEAADVEKAIEQRIYRANRMEERMFEVLDEGTIMVDTTGEAVGQVNGLSVMALGDYMIGRPSRLTCQTSIGRAGVIQIDREAKLTGRIHDKGVLTLQGFMGSRFGQKEPVQFTATLSFEQLYSELEGDSASSTELYALLSSLAGVPIKQGIAVTGSVNQRGEVQAIGGVSRKIDGFFKLCQMRGLTGDQGVLIPAANERHLMCRQEVVDACAAGQFHVWAVKTIEEGIEVLTGVPAGKPDRHGDYPPDTVFGKVQARLRAIAAALREATNGEKNDKQPPPPEENNEPVEPPKE